MLLPLLAAWLPPELATVLDMMLCSRRARRRRGRGAAAAPRGGAARSGDRRCAGRRGASDGRRGGGGAGAHGCAGGRGAGSAEDWHAGAFCLNDGDECKVVCMLVSGRALAVRWEGTFIRLTAHDLITL